MACSICPSQTLPLQLPLLLGSQSLLMGCSVVQVRNVGGSWTLPLVQPMFWIMWLILKTHHFSLPESSSLLWSFFTSARTHDSSSPTPAWGPVIPLHLLLKHLSKSVESVERRDGRCKCSDYSTWTWTPAPRLTATVASGKMPNVLFVPWFSSSVKRNNDVSYIKLLRRENEAQSKCSINAT